MPIHINLPHDKLADFCRRWNVTELSFFGSVTRDDFADDSDVDIMVDFASGKTPGLDFWTMESPRNNFPPLSGKAAMSLRPKTGSNCLTSPMEAELEEILGHRACCLIDKSAFW